MPTGRGTQLFLVSSNGAPSKAAAGTPGERVLEVETGREEATSV